MSAKTALSLVVTAVDKATGPIREIAAKLKLATAPIEAPLKRVGAAWGKFSERAGVAVGRLAAVGAGAGLALGALLKSAETAGSRLEDTADRVGLTVDAFASLEFAAKRSGVEQEAFAGAMDKFNKSLGELKAGGGPIVAFLSKVSPALLEQMKGAKGTEEALSLLTDAFKRIDDPAKSAALASAMFGKSGLQMGRFLHQGSAEIQRLQAEFIRLTGSQEAFARGAGTFGDSLDDLEFASLGLRNAFAGALFPAVTELAKGLTAFAVANRDGLKAWAEKAGAAITAWVQGGGLQRLTDALGKIADAAGWVVDKLGPMGTAVAGLAVLFAPTIAAGVSLAASLGSLAVSAFPLVKAAALAAWPAIAGAGTAIGGFLSSVAAASAPFLPFLAALASLIYLGSVIKENWGEITFLFQNFGETLKYTVLGAWDAVRPVLEKLAGWFGTNNAIGGALRLGDWATEGLRPGGNMLGAAAAAPAAALVAPPAQSSAQVSVDFTNLPRGARVSTEPNSSQPVDLSLGYSMVAP